MKTKAPAWQRILPAIKSNENLRRTAVRCAVHAAIGLVLSGGRLYRAYPLGLSFVSSVTGFLPAVSALVGVAVGSLRLHLGGYYSLTAAAILMLRAVLGLWLASPEGSISEATRNGTDASVTDRLRSIALRVVSTSCRESVTVRMTLASAGNMLCSAVRCVSSGYERDYVIAAVVAAAVSPILTLMYVYAFDPSGRAAEIGRCVLAASLVLSLKGATPYFDAAVGAAFVITVVTTRMRGSFIGTVYGVVCGAVSSPPLAPFFAASALISGAMWRISPSVAVTAACSAGCLWSVYAVGLSALSTVFPTLIITSAVLAPAVSGWTLPKTAGGERGGELAEALLRRDTGRRMKRLSETMTELSGVLYRLSDTVTSPETEELCELCEASFEECCASCGMQSACFGREAEKTSSLQARMTLALKNDGRVSAAIVPKAMAGRCYSMGQIIDKMNAGYARLVAEAKLYDRTAVVASDYEVMGEILRESAALGTDEYELDRELTARVRSRLRSTIGAESIGVYGRRVKKVIARGVDVRGGTPGGEDIRRALSDAVGLKLKTPEFELDGSTVIMRLSAEPRHTVRYGRASMAKSDAVRGSSPAAGEACGDAISAFSTGDGRFFMLISDGMGSGKEAALTSGVCAVFIEKLLRAGASMDTSLKMLNAMLRNRSREVSATVDLMELDVMNGVTRFVKSGAAPSFVLRGGRLFRLQSKTVPIGIVRALDAEMIKFECESGDIVVMLSDGVVRSFEDCPWLYDMLCDRDAWTDDPEEMARKIISCAVKNGADDDITAGVVMIE